jgi:uncharacterized protein
VVTFGRVLREAGLEVGPGRLADALQALEAVGISRQEDVYWALRATLVARQEDLEPFDRAFAAWFLGSAVAAPPRPRPDHKHGGVTRGRADPAPGGPAGSRSEDVTLGWSADDVLRRRDFGAMSPEELAAARRLLPRLAEMRPRRSSRRLRAHPRGRSLDLRRVTRRSLATGGEPLQRVYRRRLQVPRRLVLLCDISGSMQAYTRALLVFLQGAAAARHVEVFAFGTRLTRLTPALRTRDPDEALARASETVVDWAGGTLIGASIKTFNDEWGRRALTRGAVVVVASDGWERQDPELLGREMARLRRAAYAVVWVTPLKGDAAYEPEAAGMRAALPHVDRFLAGHNIAGLEELASVLAGIERRHIT